MRRTEEKIARKVSRKAASTAYERACPVTSSSPIFRLVCPGVPISQTFYQIAWARFHFHVNLRQVLADYSKTQKLYPTQEVGGYHGRCPARNGVIREQT